MSKTLQITLVALYAALIGVLSLALLSSYGLLLPRYAYMYILVAWVGLCFSAIYLIPNFYLIGRTHVRKPVLSEEQRLKPCLDEVLGRAEIATRFRLMIAEDFSLNAFAMGRNLIVLTRGILDRMTDQELKAILAHELGHHQSGDCHVSAGLMAVSQIPRLAGKAGRVGARTLHIIRRTAWLSTLGFVLTDLLLVIASLYLLVHYHLLLAAIFTLLYITILSFLPAVFRFLWNAISRFTEYKQDAYAHSLGYGRALSQALYKMTLDAPQNVSLWFVLTRSSHPVIYNRIRRLEQLEGHR